MAYVYKITNSSNGKCYIGKTERSNPIERFHEHLRDRQRYSERPLYRAINKYGPECFSFEIIEEVDNAEERETYWIQHYNSYGKAGYNATTGGEGKRLFNYEEIAKDYDSIRNMSQVAKKNNCSTDTVEKALKEMGITIIDSGEVNKKKQKSIIMLDKKTKEPIQEFENKMEAARYLKENGFSNIVGVKSLASKVGLVCRGIRQSCAGFGWKHKE
jgi:hypothetical protein